MVDPCVALYTKATILTSAGRSLCSIVRAFGVLISFGRSTPHQIKNGGEAGTKDQGKAAARRRGLQERSRIGIAPGGVAEAASEIARQPDAGLSRRDPAEWFGQRLTDPPRPVGDH